MASSGFLHRLWRALAARFSASPRREEVSLHDAHTIIAPPPPGGMRRVLPKRPVAPSPADAPVMGAAAADAVPADGIPADCRHVPALLADGQAEEALLALIRCLDQDRHFRPGADEVVPLARQAMVSNQPMLALRIMQRFDQRHPGHPDIPQVILLSARIMAGLGRKREALTLISAFHQHYAAHPLAAEAAALRKQLA